MNKAQARRSPKFLHKSVVYQIFLRTFTREGTLNAARPLLPHLKSLGIDIVYLCPIFLQDDDMREEYWSKRQKASGLNNPRNPYRIKDYYAIDPEYGTDKDLKDFVEEAHALGLRVLLDLVYYHCGPTATFLEKNPSFVKTDDNGNVLGRWNFPELNFKSEDLREYLWQNMEYFMREFTVDGYRCDVAPEVPLDFWEEGRRRMEAINPEAILISEGDRIDDQLSAFDLNYGFKWEYGVINLFDGEITATELQNIWQKHNSEFPEGARFLRIIENHDITHDCDKTRHQIRWGNYGVQAAQFLNFMLDGVPFIYNGEEIADAAPHSIYGDLNHGPRLMIDWSKAMTKEGIERLSYFRKIISLRQAQPALTEGAVEWIDNDCPESVVSFQRTTTQQKLLVVVNATNLPRTIVLPNFRKTVDEKEHLLYNCDFRSTNSGLQIDLLPYGCLLLEGYDNR